MDSIHISTVRSPHVYTRSRTPWKLDEHDPPKSRLYRYLSGGGMRAFGRSVRQEEADEKRNRFLVAAGVFGVVWLILLVV